MKKSSKSLFVFVGMITLLILVLGVLLFSGNKEIKKYQNALNSSEIRNEYFQDEATIKSRNSVSTQGYTVTFYQVSAEVNEEFEKLSDEQKYKVFLEVRDVLKQEDISYYNFSCGKKRLCAIDGFQFTHNNDVYEYKKVLLNDHFSLVLNGEEIYSTESKRKNVTSKVNDDTETTMQDKGGNDWASLSDNQKYHAVSNALYNLDQQGYTILEGEYYYILNFRTQ
ncbi:hypothetical protein [Sporosarcina limicola]|uniref:Uncharacterized protein n=1 Tax=Sporosarcina limicola TaxID=34101 RepID=A0A927MN61_9BACL|nr:hypothetical protein [Sporosarcina limicola]MBE1557023.1 hypothetical protein [Sporosarcina limicola]